MKTEPSSGESAEAARRPGGYVYRIAVSVSDANGHAPPEAIIGAWKVDADGKIASDFMPTPNFAVAVWTAKKLK